MSTMKKVVYWEMIKLGLVGLKDSYLSPMMVEPHYTKVAKVG